MLFGATGDLAKKKLLPASGCRAGDGGRGIMRDMDFRVEQLVPSGQRPVLDLFERALLLEPSYLPQDSSGEVALRSWYARKPTEWSRVVYAGSTLVGHVSARRNRTLPPGTLVPDGFEWELGRLVTAPSARRLGVATALVSAAGRAFGERLGASCVAGGASHALFTRLGWTVFSDVTYADDPAPGVALRAPRTV